MHFWRKSSRKTNIASLLGKYKLEKVRLNMKIVSGDIAIRTADADAAWELHIEMLTRIVTQPLPSSHGDEQAALDSVYSLFPITRDILRRRGRDTVEFSKIAIPVLNQVIRPFTAKWHRASLAGAFDDTAQKQEFREELKALQEDLRNYNHILAEIAGVEDLTDLEPLSMENPKGK